MSLSLYVLKKEKGMFDYDIEKDEKSIISKYFNDEKFLYLLEEMGEQTEYSSISFTKEQTEQLVKVCQSIDEKTFVRKIPTENYLMRYEEKYENETMLDFYMRWSDIIKGIKKAYQRIDWEKEHLIVYISA